MKPPPRSMRVAASPIAVLLGFVVLTCGCASPTAPTASPGPLGGAWGAGAAPAVSFSDTSTTWSCFIGDIAGGLASTSCRASRMHLSARERVTAFDAPAPSTNLLASVSGSAVTLTWLQPPSTDPATSFVIEAGSSPGAANIAVFDTGNAATTLSVSGVPAGTYFVRVRAKNSSGTSAPSNEVVITVVDAACTTGPPTGLVASVTGSAVTFTWTAPAGACAPIGYSVVAGSATGASDIGRVAVDARSTSYTASNVPLGTYFVRVIATSPGGAAGVSNEVIVTIGLRGEVTDPVGDALPVPSTSNPPDLVYGTADVAGGDARFTIQLAPGTFDVQTTLLIIYLDTDQNQATGVQTAAGGLGVDYLISMSGQSPAVIQRFVNNFTFVGTVPTTALVNGRNLTVPLPLLGGDDGRFNFRISSFVLLPNSLNPPGILDTMPGDGLPPGRVQ